MTDQWCSPRNASRRDLGRSRGICPPGSPGRRSRLVGSEDRERTAGFVGRQRELKELRDDIERTGLDTLSGRKARPARGCCSSPEGPAPGRPRSPRSSCAQVAEQYPDGVLRARLTAPGGGPSPPNAPPAICSRAGAAHPARRRRGRTHRRAPRRARRRPRHSCSTTPPTEQLDALLPDSPECLVVVAAAGPLTGIPDVRPCTLGGLDTPAAVGLLAAASAPRVTADPRAAEALAEECGDQPAALVLVGGWLAARPKASVADVAKQLHDMPASTGGPLARGFRLVYESLPQPAQRTLRLLPLAPVGIVDSHTASALAGCSVAAAQSTLDDFAGLGLLVPSRADGRFLLPGCLAPLLQALLEAKERPAEVQLARARMLERTVRLLHSCRAIAETGRARRPGEAGRRCRAPCASPTGGPPRLAGHPAARALAAACLAVADGELDTLARRLVAALVRALAAHRGTAGAAPELYGLHRLVLDVAERRDLHREQAAALLNLADLDAETGRTQEALERYRAALDAGRAANDPYATGRAMESVGGALPGAGGLAPRRRLVRPGARPAPGARRARGRGPAVRPSRHRAHLRGPLRRGAAQLACRGGRLPEARRCRRPRTGVERDGAGPGVRGPARGVAAHLPGGGGVGPPRRATYGCRPRSSCGWPTRWTGSAIRRRPGCTGPRPSGCWETNRPQPTKSAVDPSEIIALKG